MAKYAAETKVSAAQSRAEIERTLERYDAQGFLYGWSEGRAVVGFQMRDRHIKFLLPMPGKDEFHTTREGRVRGEDAAARRYQQAVRQRWRALAMVIKAKLESVESGIVTFEEEFLAHIVLPDGQTVGAFMAPQIESAYKIGEMPSMLPMLEDQRK